MRASSGYEPASSWRIGVSLTADSRNSKLSRSLMTGKRAKRTWCSMDLADRSAVSASNNSPSQPVGASFFCERASRENDTVVDKNELDNGSTDRFAAPK